MTSGPRRPSVSVMAARLKGRASVVLPLTNWPEKAKTGVSFPGMIC